MKETIIGKSILRKEGRGKVTGSARYIDDLDFPGMLHGATVRSPIARGRIRAIHFGEGIPVERIHHRHRQGYPRQELRRADHRTTSPASPTNS